VKNYTPEWGPDDPHLAVPLRLAYAGDVETLHGAMTRFFAECSTLLAEGAITLEAFARLRNALYGPVVKPLNIEEMRSDRELLREYLQRERRRWMTRRRA
jgi:hypothetical protein